MGRMTLRGTPRAETAILRKLAELKEREGWAHHVADAATGKLITTRLRRPLAPLTRAERVRAARQTGSSSRTRRRQR